LTEPNPFHEPDRFYKSEDINMGRVRAAMHDAQRLGDELTESIRAKYGLDQPPRVGTSPDQSDQPSPVTSSPCWVPSCPRTDVRAYLSGKACPDHSPAAIAGHPEPPVPDRELTAVGLAHRTDYIGRFPAEYGHAKSDPLGRVIKGNAKNGFIPRRKCSTCTGRRPAGHQGPCT
jgi:hypothetical protein